MENATVITDTPQQPQLNIPYIEGLIDNLRTKIRNYLDRTIELEVINTLQGTQLGQLADLLRKTQQTFEEYKTNQENLAGINRATTSKTTEEYYQGISNKDHQIQELELKLKNCNVHISELENLRNNNNSEIENLRKKSGHVDTFQRELSLERGKTKELSTEIGNLKDKLQQKDTEIDAFSTNLFIRDMKLAKALEYLPRRRQTEINNFNPEPKKAKAIKIELITKDGGEF